MADPATDAVTRGKLQLVIAARAFAAESLHLETGESFTTYSALDRDTLVLVVSAAYRDTLAFYTWWFPIVGRVPYKGFFRTPDALAQAEQLARAGLDTVVRPASAFSTLGFFNDPLLSTTIAEDSASLANTVIHELLHNTFYAPGETAFNESFANFVGARGAMRFFQGRGDSAHAARAAVDWEREKLLGRFWSSVYAELDSAFKAHAGDRGARLAARDTIFARARDRFERDVRPGVQRLVPGVTLVLRLDNATLMARRLYRTGLDDFDAVYAREERDLPARDHAHHRAGAHRDPRRRWPPCASGWPQPAPKRPRSSARRSTGVPVKAADGSTTGGCSGAAATRVMSERTPRSMKRDSWSIE